MNLKEAEATQDEEDSFETVIANILKEVREFCIYKTKTRSCKKEQPKNKKVLWLKMLLKISMKNFLN